MREGYCVDMGAAYIAVMIVFTTSTLMKSGQKSARTMTRVIILNGIDEYNTLLIIEKMTMNTNNPEIKFANISVSFEEFVDILASKIALRMYQIEKGQLEISQAKAFKMFGRADVERWVKSGKLTPCRISPGKKKVQVSRPTETGKYSTKLPH